MRVKIGERWVGEGEPVYVIAEAGSNHNGNLEQALRLIDAGAEAGANAVKFQNFRAAKLYARHAGEAAYLKDARGIYEIVEALEIPEAWVPQLAAYCREKGVAFISSPFDEASADLIAPHVPVVKVASYEMTHSPLLRHIARLGKPMIVSTGTATLDEVLRAVEGIVAAGNEQIILLQCTASYPTPREAVNARAITTLRRATGRPVGLSDHSRDPIIAPVVATALGACVIEKHFTLSTRLPGPDHKFALEPGQLAQMVKAIRAAEQVLGHGRKEVLEVEQELRKFARRSIFAVRAISAGETLSSDNIAVLRRGKAGEGLEPDAYGSLLGRRAVRNMSAGTLIGPEDFA